MAIALRYAARSDIGLGRYINNQDSGYAGPHLLVVADGMGGHAGGDVASSITVGAMVGLDGDSHGGEALELLAAALRDANDELRRRAGADPDLVGMGTTTTALMRYGSKLALAHIGDSRGYLLREGQLTRITHDHSFVQSLIDEGRISEEEAERHPQRSVVTRVLTGDPHDEPDLSVREARVGDRYLLCSDGLTDVVRDRTIAETLAEHGDPAGCAEAFVAMALRAGGRDNITCIVAHVVDVASESEATTTAPVAVGAVAVHGTGRSAAAHDTPAAKAAALERSAGGHAVGDPAAGSPDDGTDAALAIAPPASARRWALRSLLAVLVLTLLGGGGFAAYSWSQHQYFVGADGSSVAIYRGLPQDIGPVRLSSVYEASGVELASLPQYSREQVSSTITADGLGDARRKVTVLRAEADGCATPAPSPTPSATATFPVKAAAEPTPAGTPIATVTGAGTARAPTGRPSATPTATPSTTPTSTPTPTPSSTPTTGTPSTSCAGAS